MKTLLETRIIRSIKSFSLQFLYGISITIPFSTSYDVRLIPGVIFFSSLINFVMLLYPLYKFNILSKNCILFISILIASILFIIIIIYNNYIQKFLDKIWAEKYYWLDINSHKEEHYSELIRTHRNVSKYNRLKYMKNKSLVDEYKKYNMKWRLIAVIYILITTFNVYLLDKLNF